MGEPLEPGRLLGPYEIGAMIGAGGMGQVYRAHDPRLGRDVAIKTLSGAGAADPEGAPQPLPERLAFEQRSGEVALTLGSHFDGVFTYGTLARVPIAGGAPTV
jgi:serine/threonine protein kinase